MENLMIRSELHQTKKAIENNHLTIGFLGGSITENRVPHNWTDVLISSILSQYPSLRLNVHNAAIGATGSDFGLIRVREDIIQKSCDLVFIEYAVNDYYTPQTRRNDQMEGLIRRIRNESNADIILVYTYLQEMYHALINQELPEIIQDYEKIADYYQVSSIFVGNIAFHEVQQGSMRYEEWLPDGLHPQFRGSYTYGKAVYQALVHGLHVTTSLKPMPIKPLSPHNWEHAKKISFNMLEVKHPFYIKRSSTQVFVNDVIFTSAIGAKLKIKYEGKGLVLVFDFGKKSSEFSYRIDQGEWIDVKRDRPSWVGYSGWLRPIVLGEHLAFGLHEIELVVTHGLRPDCEGTNFELTHIMALQ